jgi:predicted transcriptional regulator
MTKREYILDCLIDDDEAFTQIIEYFMFINVAITSLELEELLSEMVDDGLISINRNWKNEKNEYPYSLTHKGKILWHQLPEI